MTEPAATTETPPLRLKVTAGNAQGRVIKIEDELLIGRHAEGDGKLDGDPEISRRHAKIARAAHGFAVEDMGSTNGTIVNGREIAAAETLSPGDEIEVGATKLIVQVSSPTPPPTPSPAPTEPELPAIPRIALKVELDLEGGEARVELSEGSDAVRLVFDDGRWVIKGP